jgi:post-segregation antitoxin (ccd killing protein)
MRRITVTADHDALEALKAEARRRGVSMSVLLREAIDEKAARIHAARRPRIGRGRSADGRSAVQLTAEPVAEPPA